MPGRFALALMMIAFACSWTAEAEAKSRSRQRPLAPSQGHCRHLTLKQADKAISLLKINLHKGQALVLRSQKDGGLFQPRGIWREKIRSKGRIVYRVVADGRRLDLATTYLPESERARRAWNLAVMVGCTPPKGTAVSIDL